MHGNRISGVDQPDDARNCEALAQCIDLVSPCDGPFRCAEGEKIVTPKISGTIQMEESSPSYKLYGYGLRKGTPTWKIAKNQLF